MATTAIWAIKGRLDTVLNYTGDKNKTEEMAYSNNDLTQLCDVMYYATQKSKTQKHCFISGINCFTDRAREQMMLTKKRFSKTGGNIAYHGYQSFADGEVTPKIAHEIGVKLAEKLWGDSFEVVVATHLDKDCLHNHFVINSVSFVDGKKYNDCKASYKRMRETSDELCREYRLSVVEAPKWRGKHFSEWQAEQSNQSTWRGLIREDIDAAIMASFSYKQFLQTLKSYGYDLKTNVKYTAVRPKGKERFVRLISLGDDYTSEAIQSRILYGKNKKRRTKADIFRPYLKGGIRGLYYHYLYALGIIGENEANHQSVPFIIKEKLLVQDDLINEYDFMVKHGIDTITSLNEHELQCKERIVILSDKESCSESEKKALSDLRKEVKYCENIKRRSKKMMAEQAQLEKEEQNKQEENQCHTMKHLNKS